MCLSGSRWVSFSVASLWLSSRRPPRRDLVPRLERRPPVLRRKAAVAKAAAAKAGAGVGVGVAAASPFNLARSARPG
jgi:hypothetical protein